MEIRYRRLLAALALGNTALIALIVALVWGPAIARATGLSAAAHSGAAPSVMHYQGSLPLSLG